MRIGIDFDNTLISYDSVFLEMAQDRGLVDAAFRGSKQAVRDAIRLLPEGELAWQRLQGQVYGKGIGGARMFDGVDTFLRRSRMEGVTVLIVSHKTEFGHYDPDAVNLRQAALGWMTAHGFFQESAYAIPAGNVYFESTRGDKLARIAALNCTYFIDDLEEVLTDPKFPASVKRILFSDETTADAGTPYAVCPSWRRIEDHIFNGRN